MQNYLFLNIKRQAICVFIEDIMTKITLLINEWF